MDESNPSAGLRRSSDGRPAEPDMLPLVKQAYPYRALPSFPTIAAVRAIVGEPFIVKGGSA